MKALIFVALAFVCANAHVVKNLGAKECTWGPSYWCSNLTAAAGCRAVKHCIQNVWEHKTYPEDNDSVCQTCLNMVKQARDQLESNETQEEIKEVFEGSCKLIPIKLVNQECCKLADEFIPDLVDTLASQMNPQVVCSVAGLCNNAKIDKMLEEQANDITKKPVEKDNCMGCHKVVDLMSHKFNTMTRDNFLQDLLHVCARMGSFSDACSNIIITYFTEIYSHMQSNFNSDNICILSGQCSMNFHVHEVEITPLSDVGVVPVNDDLPCELCEQLVGHLRDLLIANTTESEFKLVMEGLCKQTKSFKEQCLSIVDEYYPVIYSFLVGELNSTELCTMIQICPAPTLTSDLETAPIIPLLPVETVPLVKQLTNPGLHRVGVPNDNSNVKIFNQNQLFEAQNPEMMQLPIERMHGPQVDPVYNNEVCVFCEYFLHYLQQAITNPKTEDSIKDEINKACTKLPSAINETCVQFVNTYGDAFVALLAQEIDPSTICPLIRVCPSEKTDIEVFMKAEAKPNCPLCLFAVTKLEEMVKDGKTRENIKHALNSLCSELSGRTAEECTDFVNTYTDELVEMLADDFKPQEVCVYLKLCDDKKPAPQLGVVQVGGIINTNEIPDFTANGQVLKPSHSVSQKPQCVLCEFVMDKLETMLKDKKTEDEIKQAIHGVCNDLPKSVSKECNDFVDQYADIVFNLIIASVQPNEICQVMNLCDKKTEIAVPKPVGSPQCMICKLVMNQIEELLVGKVSEDDIKDALDSVCSFLPRAQENDCNDFIANNYKKIYKLLVLATAPGEICSLMFFCGEKQAIEFQINKCAVCEATVVAVDKILQNPKADHSIEHVLEKACRALPEKHQMRCRSLIDEYGFKIFNLVFKMADSRKVCLEIHACTDEFMYRPKREVHLLGSSKCTWGPNYWCEKESNAKDCGDGAYKHCEKHVWQSKPPPQ